jgi:pilus assembly protein CpaF
MPPERSPVDLAEGGFMSPNMGAFLGTLVEQRFNILIGGGAGAGRTTLLNALRPLIGPGERVAFLDREEGMRERLREATASPCDRLVVDEIRGPEALDLLGAMEAGCACLAVIHSRTARDSAVGLERMALNADLEGRALAIRHRIGSNLHFLVQVGRFSDGSRRVTNITEISGVSGETLILLDIFVFEKRGLDPDGRVRGRFRATGLRPRAYARLVASGIGLPRDFFEDVQEV